MNKILFGVGKTLDAKMRKTAKALRLETLMILFRSNKWKLLTFVILSIFISIPSFFNSVIAGEPDHDPFFEVRKLESLDIIHLWHAEFDSQTLSSEAAIVKYWSFNHMFRRVYGNEKVPVAIVLVGDNHLNAKPVGYQIFAKKKASVARAMTGAPSGYHGDALFAFLLKENGCQTCEEGRILVVEDNGEFVLETSENVGFATN